MQIIRTRILLILVFIAIFTLYHAQLDKGLISAYYFSGNANDSMHVANGTVRGASLTPDRFGNLDAAFSFDGYNDYITLGTNSDLKQIEMSISMWVKINSYNSLKKNYPGIAFLSTRVRPEVQCYEAYTIGLYLSNHKFAVSGYSPVQQRAACMSKLPSKINVWTHLIYMFDTDTAYLYVDGKLQQKSLRGFIPTYMMEDSVVLGYAGNHMPDTFKYQNYAWFNGCLDDIKFYNRILTPSEIIKLYQEANSKFGEVENNSSNRIGYFLSKFWHLLVFFVILLVIAIYSVRWRIKYIRRKEKEKSDLQQKFAQIEMQALRSQMNPHFIFNAINSIQHYVLTNEKELASKYLVKFSQLMRNILDLSKQELISLRDELETVKLYVEIESLRFNNAFSFSLNVSSDVNVNDIRLPPLIIQPFAENAIWHGLLLKEGNKELIINVFKEDANVIIELDDNGIGRLASSKFSNKELKRRSFGMEITNDRLNLLEKIFGISISFKILDKVNDENKALGTKVLISIKL